MKVWLETSVVIQLHFRNAAVALAARKAVPENAETVVSRYVLFELARGYLSSLRELHNASFGCQTRHDLRKLVKDGNARYTYKGPTWTDVLDDDLFLLEQEPDAREAHWEKLLPNMFRARLRTLIENGWADCCEGHSAGNPTGCRADLPPPAEDADGRLAHDLPLSACGQPGNCGVLAFSRKNEAGLRGVQKEIGKSKAKAKKGERERRMAGLEHLLGVEGEEFDGTHCHNCGDAMIAAEAGTDAVVTKDRDFLKICKALGAPEPVVVRHS